MGARLELWRAGGREVVGLEATPASIGQGAGNDIVLDDDTVSHLHAVLEEFRGGWSIRDLNSRNGTYVNGERVFKDRALREGDELRLGRHRLVFHSDRSDLSPPTAAPDHAPPVTPREREVLIALCRPLLAGDLFTEPASIREIADDLTVTEAAVKQHLRRLYEKFGIHERGERRRLRLANQAMRRGAVGMADLVSPEG